VPTATVTARLSNGGWVVTICADGKCEEQQSLPPAKVRELLTIKAERDSFAAQLAAVKEQVAILERIKAIDDRIEANQAEEIKRCDAALTSANNLVFEAMELADGYRKGARTGKLVAVLNSPYVKIFSLIIPPLAAALSK
jgi:hypothetical protein